VTSQQDFAPSSAATRERGSPRCARYIRKHSLYLKGRYNARTLTAEGQRKAIRYFQDSIRLDPHDASAYYYASAYAGIAECFIELAYFFGMEPKEAFAEAEVAAVKAVTLDAALAEGHAALGLLRLLNDWDWGAADAESRQAIELAPQDPYVHWRRGVCLRYAGRSEEAVAAHRQAEFLDPFSVVAIQEVGWALYYSRRFDEAIDQFHKAVELEPGWDQLYFGLGQTLVQQERHEEAVAALRTAARMGPVMRSLRRPLPTRSAARAAEAKQSMHWSSS
jgi:tetratricopeptide (TPR) repeat protein